MTKIRLPPRPPDPLVLRVLNVAIADLRSEAAQSVVDKFKALVEQMKVDQEQLERLRIDFYGEGPGERWTHDVGVRQVRGFAEGVPPREVWRFKMWELENLGLRFRIFYGYFDRTRTLVILGVTSRDDATYDFTGQFLERVSNDYDRVHAAFG